MFYAEVSDEIARDATHGFKRKEVDSVVSSCLTMVWFDQPAKSLQKIYAIW